MPIFQILKSQESNPSNENNLPIESLSILEDLKAFKPYITGIDAEVSKNGNPGSVTVHYHIPGEMIDLDFNTFKAYMTKLMNISVRIDIAFRKEPYYFGYSGLIPTFDKGYIDMDLTFRPELFKKFMQ